MISPGSKRIVHVPAVRLWPEGPTGPTYRMSFRDFKDYVVSGSLLKAEERVS